jgi:hypothetical protein
VVGHDPGFQFVLAPHIEKIGIGVLLLLIGYYSPLPPKAAVAAVPARAAAHT